MRKVVYLTIDDCPSPSFVDKVDFLFENKIPAVLFCQGSLMQENKDAVRYAIRKGFPIGNHAYTHTHFSCLPLKECLYEIAQTDDLIQTLYSQEGISFYHKIFRFPYGDRGDLKFGYFHDPSRDRWIRLIQRKGLKLTKHLLEWAALCTSNRVCSWQDYIRYRAQMIQSFLRERGYRQGTLRDVNYSFYQTFASGYDWSWTFDAMEWSGLPSGDIVQRLTEANPRDERGKITEEHGLCFNGSADIMLLHDHSSTTGLFFQIIEHLLQKGVVFKTPLEDVAAIRS